MILDANPVHTAPCQDWEALLAHIPLTLHTGLYRDETGRRCRWHVPALHGLESWGDLRTFDHRIALQQQPLITRLYAGRSPLEVLGAVAGEVDLVEARSPAARPAQRAGLFSGPTSYPDVTRSRSRSTTVTSTSPERDATPCKSGTAADAGRVAA